jgi:hypothetical protein
MSVERYVSSGQLGRRTARATATMMMLIAALLLAPAPSAHASDCESVAGAKICGHVYNHSGWELVAASLDKRGGQCPPYGRCGTCAVPAHENSKRAACARVFKDADVFTYDNTSFTFDGKDYPRHTYKKFPSSKRVDCYNNKILRKPACWSDYGQ